jgi:60 kDa SS-A/Ro ribonucleoprotein
MRTNVLAPPPKNNEGVTAFRINAEQELRRSVMACMLWEDSFYEAGVAIADRIADLVRQVNPDKVAAIAVEARERMKLRHAPLWLCVALAKRHELKAETLATVIQRADEMAEFLSLYSISRDETKKLNRLSHQVKKGLALAFAKFNEYALAKYDRQGAIKLRDVLRLVHPKPKDAEQSALWKRVNEGTLATPDTWEVELSASKDKKASWQRLLAEKKLFALALLRNLRNMNQAGVDKATVASALSEIKTDRVLPFRFIAAARAVPSWEDIIEPVMLRSMEGAAKLRGKTVLLIDTSPSMAVRISAKSDLSRMDAGFGLAVLLRELCEDVEIWSFSQECRQVPSRRGFALADAIRSAVPSNGTFLGKALTAVSGRYDRLIVITDEESQDPVGPPDTKSKAYMVNVATSKNGVGYGAWTHVDGWSEAIVDYIRASESVAD